MARAWVQDREFDLSLIRNAVGETVAAQVEELPVWKFDNIMRLRTAAYWYAAGAADTIEQDDLPAKPDADKFQRWWLAEHDIPFQLGEKVHRPSLNAALVEFMAKD